MPIKTQKNKPGKTSLLPKTRIGSFLVVDAKQIVKTLPANAQKQKYMLEGIERKLAAQAKANAKPARQAKIRLPTKLTTRKTRQILEEMGFREKDGRFFHAKYSTIQLRPGASEVFLEAFPQLRKAITDYLRAGNRI